MTKEVAESIGLGKPRGALVQSVETDGPADKAGVEAGDIITKVDGKAVEKSGDLPRIIGGTKPGTKADAAGLPPRQLPRRRPSPWPSSSPTRGRRAVRAEPSPAPRRRPRACSASPSSDLTDAQKRELKLRGGVRVEAVDGAAARAGLREGDVILSLDNTEITDSKQFATVAAKAEKARKRVSVLVRRGEWRQLRS